jgi:hypothetical protein
MSKKSSRGSAATDEEQGGLLSAVSFSVDTDDMVESAKDSFYTMTSNISSINDALSSQMNEITNSLPSVEVGPFSAEYRGRLMTSLYLIIGSAFFMAVAIFVGLPTLVIKPSKFVLCITISTLLTIASVIHIQKPSVFLAALCTGDPYQKIPFVLLIVSVIATGYVTIFVHAYTYILVSGIIQCLSILFFLASYIPGGQTGLIMVLRAAAVVVRTAVTPVLFCCKQTAQMLYRRVTS